MKRSSIAGLLIMAVIAIGVGAYTTGCGTMFSVATVVLDNSPELNQRLDDRWRDRFDKNPEKAAEVYTVTTTILDQFDGPPATTTGAAIKIAGVAIKVEKLNPTGQKVVKYIGFVIEAPIVAFAAKYGIIDQGQLANLVGRALKRANRISAEYVTEQNKAASTGAMDSQALACERCGLHQPVAHSQRGGDTLSRLLSNKGSTMIACGRGCLTHEWTTV